MLFLSRRIFIPLIINGNIIKIVIIQNIILRDLTKFKHLSLNLSKVFFVLEDFKGVTSLRVGIFDKYSLCSIGISLLSLYFRSEAVVCSVFTISSIEEVGLVFSLSKISS